MFELSDPAIIQTIDILRREKHILLRVRPVDNIEGFASMICRSTICWIK